MPNISLQTELRGTRGGGLFTHCSSAHHAEPLPLLGGSCCGLPARAADSPGRPSKCTNWDPLGNGIYSFCFSFKQYNCSKLISRATPGRLHHYLSLLVSSHLFFWLLFTIKIQISCPVWGGFCLFVAGRG